MSLKEMVPLLSGKGRILLLIFFSIPFCQIFGLAIPFGLLIAYFGLGYAFSLKPILPKVLLRRKFHSRILTFVFKQLLYCLRKIEKISHPRLIWICNHSLMRKINGILIFFIGIAIAISLPIPLSSYIASAALLFLGIGFLNDDGVLVLIGYPIALFYIVFVIVTLDYIPLFDIVRNFLIHRQSQSSTCE